MLVLPIEEDFGEIRASERRKQFLMNVNSAVIPKCAGYIYIYIGWINFVPQSSQFGGSVRRRISSGPIT